MLEVVARIGCIAKALQGGGGGDKLGGISSFLHGNFLGLGHKTGN